MRRSVRPLLAGPLAVLSAAADVSIGVVAPAGRFYGREQTLAAAVVGAARKLEEQRSSALRKSSPRWSG